MSINRTHLSAWASALAAACLLAAGPAHAGWQPTKTLKIVVVAAGGGTRTPEFAQHVERSALAPTFLEGAALADCIEADVARAHGVLQDAGWLVK
jgi:tripartite-type tricarboxylate transporter receptor subunit TctC